MTNIKVLIDNFEKMKIKLIVLNDIYDEIFQPWILIESNAHNTQSSMVPEEFRCDNKSDNDLNILYKLQNILITATNVKENQKKIEKKCDNSQRQVISKQVPKIPVPKAFNEKKSVIKDSNLSVNRKYIPVHLRAPFQTDPNLHRPKSNFIVRNRMLNVKNKNENHNQNNKSSKFDSKSKTEKVNSEIVEIDQSNTNIGEILFQIQNDIKNFQEKKQPEPCQIETTVISTKTIKDAGNMLKIPSELKNECKNYKKLNSKLADIYLHKIKYDASMSIIKPKANFVKQITLDIYRAKLIQNVLEKVHNISALLDLESCNTSQIGFVQALFSWILSEYMEIQNVNTLTTEKEFDKIEENTHCLESNEIRNWLDCKLKAKNVPKNMEYSVFQAAYVTNCPFVSLVNFKKNQPISLTVRNLGISPFRFSIANNDQILSGITPSELFTRMLIINQQLHLFWAPLLKNWSEVLKTKHRNGENVASFYRQLYGLLLGKFPVLLKDIN